MIRLVLITQGPLINYKVFEGKKCIAEFIEETGIALPAAYVEELRTRSYTVA